MHIIKKKGFKPCFAGVFGGFLFVAILAFSLTDGVSARFSPNKMITHVEIDGVDYGTFGHINDLRDITSQGDSKKSYTTVRLSRDFVTDKSLYLWARKASETRSGSTDIKLTLMTPEGEKVSRYVLKSGKPLSWTVEAAGPAIGGFYEKVDLAVQEIAIY